MKNFATSPDTSNSEKATLIISKLKHQWICQVVQVCKSVDSVADKCYSHQLNMANTVEDSNEKHLAPWSAACERDGIHTTPLSPYLDQVSKVVRHPETLLWLASVSGEDKPNPVL